MTGLITNSMMDLGGGGVIRVRGRGPDDGERATVRAEFPCRHCTKRDAR